MIGETVSHYKVIDKLGEGGMGVVYKAEDISLRRVVALKFINEEYLGGEEERARFTREARSAGALNHPNICTIYEIGDYKGRPFIAMEYVEGAGLDEKIESGPMDLSEAIYVAFEIAQALRAAHSGGVIHRDIKPANVMLTQSGGVKIMDFGLAKSETGTRVTKTGTTLGTLAYMSPEQIQGSPVDKRTDIWSLGVLMYEMIAGGLPFKSDYDMALAYSIRNLDHQPLSGLRREAPPGLCRIVDRCLEKDAEERYSDASELISGLSRVREEFSEPEVTEPTDEAAVGAGDASRRAKAGDGFQAGIGAEPPEGTPRRIGGYTVKQMIGSGGMGTVYVAIQDRPRRTVALKMMKTGIASRSALRRFEYEAQILARLRHPNIAQIYEAGTHEEGGRRTPFFVMEYIPGARPITEYAKTHNLSTRRRLELFGKVCDAVHHGHQKGIIHRDLKPANILVDSNGEPKIIDFGVARATDSDLAVTTLQTDIGQLVGTLQYMSPEQCEADPHDLDTRSDVYSLGVLLYELLCEKLPYDLAAAGIYHAAKIIKEEAPPRPSTFDRTLRGDVETIALKALEKERERRYQSADELKRDVGRYLSGDPIAARPPSVMYQVSVFARRNRALVGSIVGVMAVSIVAAAVSTTMYFRSETAREEAERRFAIAREGADLLLDGLCNELPKVIGASRVRKELLEKAQGHYEKLAAERVGDLETERLIWLGFRNIGSANLNLNELEQARSAMMKFNELAKRAVEKCPDDPRYLADLSSSHFELSLLCREEGKLAEAKSHQEECLELAERIVEIDPQSPRYRRWLAASTLNLGVIYEVLDDRETAETMYRRVFAISDSLHTEYPEDIRYGRLLSSSYASLSNLARFRGDLEEAKRLRLARRELNLELVEKEPTFPRILSHVMEDERELGNLSLDVGDLEGAERHYGEALRLAREMLAADPTLPWFQLELAVNQQLLGELALRKERLNEAEDYFNDALTILDRLVSLDPITVPYKGELWRAYHRLSRLAELRGEEASALDYRKRAFSIAEDLMERSPLELAHPKSMLLDSRILTEEAFERGDVEAVKSWEAKSIKAFRHLAESERVAGGDLNEYAWFLLTCRTPEFRDPETALEHGLRASRMLNDEDAATLDTVALAYHMTGDHEAAVEAQQKAIELLEAGGSEVHEDFRERLRRYEDAAGRTNN